MRLSLRRFGAVGAGSVLLATGATTGATSQAQAFTNGVIAGKIYPASNSTNAVGIYRADGTTQDVYYDSTNGRLGVGGTPTAKLDILTTSTTTSTTTNGVLVSNTVSPTGNSTAEMRSLALSTIIDTANTLTGSGLLLGVRGEVRVYNANTVSMLTAGIAGYGLTLGSNAVTLSGTVTEVNGVMAFPISSFSNSLTTTITRANGIRIRNSTNTGSGPLTITGQAGLVVDNLTAGSNNTLVLLGTNTIPSGNFAVYSASTNNSSFSGNVGFGAVTAPTATVHAGASSTARASICAPHGAAPTAPVDGDIWTTTAGLFVRINGVTKTVTLT